MDMVDRETGEQSDFYKFIRRIWNYMKRQKDEKGIDFPIFGICQGFELIHFLANEDDKDTLGDVPIFSESRPICFAVDNVKDYSLFRDFPDWILEKLEEENLAVHAHNWVVKTDTYAKSELLRNFFDILAVDELNGEEFVMAVEGKKYPVTGVMFHPESQNRHAVFHHGITDNAIKGKVNTEVTEAINYYFSKHLHDQGLKTLETHKFADAEFGKRMEWLNSNMGFTKGGLTSLVKSYGF